ncbi:Zinc transporter [Coemansia sp. RSA 2526]|nr:Zinc transporter [Coemansia sp. RSA 2526]
MSAATLVGIESMASSSTQAWLFAMTSGLASAIGGATLYLDPVLHALGMSQGFNILDSHLVLSAMLASASGAMAYTSISVLTRESIDYLEHCTAWPVMAKYAGAIAACLFIAGAFLNLLLGRVVSLITPDDSPIKHTCGSHPPSPSGSHPPSPGGSQDGASVYCGGHAGGSQTIQVDDSDSEEHRCGSSSSSAAQLTHRDGEHQPLLPLCSNRGPQPCRCEYACTEPGCYSLEHCHITPMYPHVHMHGHEQHSDHRHAPDAANAGTNGDHCVQHAHSHTGEPAVRLAGPGTRSASQISSHHHRLLIHVGLQTAVAIGLHKIPEGLIIYLSRQASPKLGVSVAASLFFHNLPEGIMLALPLFLATGRRHMSFVVASLLGAVPPAVGAALGMLLLADVGHKDARLAGIFAVAFGITAGMMCMVSLNGMLPTARIYDKSGNVVAWCFALGVAFMLFANTTLG